MVFCTDLTSKKLSQFGLSLLNILANQEQFFGRKGREEERKGRKEGGRAFSLFAAFASFLRVLCVLTSSTHLRSG